jgi:hypothetical protein
VSHSKIRTGKTCLNCGTETPGSYCPACGQLNIEPKQSVWHLINHFFSDITHFDGKFFVTVKDLFLKPGFLSREYMIGRRMSYLDPIRMYIFTSAIFFLIFFSLVNVKKMHIGEGERHEIKTDSGLAEILAEAKNAQDSLKILRVYKSVTGPVMIYNADSTPRDVRFNLAEGDYPSLEAYDSAQKALPPNQRHGWLKRKIETKEIELNLRYKKEKGELFKELLNNYIHNCPKVLFISLPVFALLLKLL